METIATENVDQARAWDGDEGETWAAQEQRYDAALRAYRWVFNDACAVRSTDRVLDVGCGNGQSSRDAARTAEAVLGVDLSGQMIRVAADRAAAEDLANVEFRQLDAQVHPFAEASFDAIISRTGTMFFGDRAAAFANLARALKPGGRLTLLTWQRATDNAWFTAIRDNLGGPGMPGPPPGAPSPFALAEPEQVRPMLAAAGFTDITFEAAPGTFHLGADVPDAVGFVAGTGVAQALLGRLDEAGRTAALDRLAAALGPYAADTGVDLPANAWIITARRAQG